jgi:lipopolysaccharide export system permease protein
MRLVDRHIFCEFAQTFAMALGVMVGLLILERIYDTLPDLLGFRASYLQIVSYYVMAIPGFLPTLIPVSLLVALLFSLGNLCKNNEITALRAGGLSLWRITRTLWGTGLALALLLLWLSASVIPSSVVRAREIWDNLAYDRQLETQSSDDVGLLYNLTFFNTSAHRLWFINRYSQYTTIAKGLTVSQQDASGHETTRLIANEGYFDDYLGYWTLEDGRQITFDAQGEPIRSLPFAKRAAQELTENPLLMQALEKKPDALSLQELHTLLHHLHHSRDPRVKAYEVRYQSMLAAPWACLLVVGLALPFALGGTSRNPMVSASQSVILFFVYYFVARLFGIMGARDALDPILAAWLPLAITAVAIPFLFKKKLG